MGSNAVTTHETVLEEVTISAGHVTVGPVRSVHKISITKCCGLSLLKSTKDNTSMSVLPRFIVLSRPFHDSKCKRLPLPMFV